MAHQAAGIALRDLGHLDDGLAELRRALRSARASGQPQRQADVRASLGITMARAGHTARGLGHLDAAAAVAHGALAGRVLMRRAAVLVYLGRWDEALQDFNQVVTILHRHGDLLWEARAHSHRGVLLLYLGHTRRADADLDYCERYFKLAGQEWEYATTRHNRGLVAAASGRVPEALELLAEADAGYAKLGTPMLDVAIDRCAILLAAGLAADAWEEADAAVRRQDPDIRRSTKFAELLYASATAALAAHDPRAATDRAEQAARLFRRQHRERWSARTRLVLAQAQHAAGQAGAGPYRLARTAARQLDDLKADEATEAHLLAGQLAQPHDAQRAEEHLAAAARSRRAAPALSQSRAQLARALLCQLRGREDQMLAACRRGLAILADQQQLLGASELRAAVTTHGRELAAIGQRAALGRGDARRLLAWSERWRATVQAITPTRLPPDDELARQLSALREVSRRLDRDLAAAPQVPALRRERARLEAAVRARILRTPGPAGAPAQQAFTPRALIDALDGAALAELVELDGTLHVVTVRGTAIRMHTVGGAEEAAREAGFARFLLRRLSSGRVVPEAGAALADAGRLLEQAVLGPAAADLEAGTVVIVPTGRLSAIPWGLLPALRGRSVSVSPSATAWLRARQAAVPGHRDVMLVAGPGLPAAGTEMARLAGLYPQATMLAGGTATARRVLAGLDGAWLAHVAAHGTFRADNPLLSTLYLDDGPLTVYDIEALARGPYRLVLSACDAGRTAPAGAGELLGLASSLLPMGTAGLVAAVTPVNDQVTPSIMESLHRAVAAGAGFPDALRLAQAAVADDPIRLATACSFIALGV